MTPASRRDEACQRLLRTRAHDRTALADEWDERARRAHRICAASLAGADARAAANARRLLHRGRELAVGALIERRDIPLASMGWAIRTAVDEHDRLRRDLLRRLDDSLDDRRPLAEGSRSMRVCDAALLALLKLLRPEDDEMDPSFGEKELLAASLRKRDAIIAGLRRTGSVRRAKEG
jgi:hypothetical protein